MVLNLDSNCVLLQSFERTTVVWRTNWFPCILKATRWEPVCIHRAGQKPCSVDHYNIIRPPPSAERGHGTLKRAWRTSLRANSLRHKGSDVKRTIGAPKVKKHSCFNKKHNNPPFEWRLGAQHGSVGVWRCAHSWAEIQRERPVEFPVAVVQSACRVNL